MRDRWSTILETVTKLLNAGATRRRQMNCSEYDSLQDRSYSKEFICASCGLLRSKVRKNFEFISVLCSALHRSKKIGTWAACAVVPAR